MIKKATGDQTDGKISPLESHATEVRRVTRIGLAANLILSGLKLAGGILGSSQAVIADAVHSLSDCVTDLAILIGVRYWTRPPDSDHPYGHRRIETVVTVFIGLALAAVSFGLVYNAIISFNEPRSEVPGPAALVAALISIAVKEALYRWTRSAGERIKSSALVANAWHQRTDALSSIPAALAVAISWFDPSLIFFDGIGVLLVSLFILHAAWRIIVPGIDQLTDKGVGSEETDEIRNLALQVKNVRGVHKVRTRFAGLGLQVDLHVLVDGDLTVCQGHDIAGEVTSRLLENKSHVVDVIVHIEPYEED
ncbi:MAG: cation transporter [Proteobacteria bacterium]|nr:cation transporter [Pseudomonadota bacterium]